MPNDSSYKISLEPKTLKRAKFILGFLLLLLIILVITGIHGAVASGDFERIFLKPFGQFATDFEANVNPSPTPTFPPLPTLTASPTPSPTAIPVYLTPKQWQPVFSNCIRKNIREGEFASNKCYSQQDYEDLEYYLGRYRSAKFDLSGAEGSMRITCNCRVQKECDFFKNSCERDKQQKSQAEADINKYRGIIQGIISKGK